MLSAKAGTPIADIERLLAQNGQELAFEPMDCTRLLGGEGPKTGTLGGAIGANLAGPRRLKAGSARDHILGINAVSGRGEAFNSGGRVVKNVTGDDLSKLMTGAWARSAVLTDMTIKALPAAETETTCHLRPHRRGRHSGYGAGDGFKRRSRRGALAARRKRAGRERHARRRPCDAAVRRGFGPSLPIGSPR